MIMEQNIITIDFNTFGIRQTTDIHETDRIISDIIEMAYSSVDESAYIATDNNGIIVGYVKNSEREKRDKTFEQLFKLRDANLILSEVYPSPKPLNSDDFKNAERDREDAFNELKKQLEHCPQIKFVRAGSLKDKPKFKTEYQLPIASLYDYLRKNKVIADSIDLETFTDSIMRGWFLPLWPEGTQVKLKRIAFHLKQYFEKKWFESVCNSIKQTKHEMSQTNFGSKNAKSKFDDEVLSILPKI